MRLKSGVNPQGVQPATWFALGVAEVVYRNINRELVVTSLNDSHELRPQSLHNKGLAADIRTRHLGKQETTDVFSRLKNILDYMGYDVILEKDHIHIEFDPKGDEDWQKIENV